MKRSASLLFVACLLSPALVALGPGCTGDDGTDAGDGDGDTGDGDGDTGDGDGDTGDGDGDAGDGDGDGDVGDGDGDGPGGDCADADPLTNQGWAGFCADRVDDNCTQDVVAPNCVDGLHDRCVTGDEPCPATQPGSAAPVWECSGAPPANVIAFGHFDTPNDQVTSFCTYVYESDAVAGEFYAAITMTNGNAPTGPAHPAGGSYCMHDFTARRHLYYSDLDSGDCPAVTYIHAYPDENDGVLYPTELQLLSNDCRKMVRNVSGGGNNDSTFNPDIQYFAASRAEADAKLGVLETAEIACIGINNLAGDAYRDQEEWISQASTTLQLTGN